MNFIIFTIHTKMVRKLPTIFINRVTFQLGRETWNLIIKWCFKTYKKNVKIGTIFIFSTVNDRITWAPALFQYIVVFLTYKYLLWKKYGRGVYYFSGRYKIFLVELKIKVIGDYRGRNLLHKTNALLFDTNGHIVWISLSGANK